MYTSTTVIPSISAANKIVKLRCSGSHWRPLTFRCLIVIVGGDRRMPVPWNTSPPSRCPFDGNVDGRNRADAATGLLCLFE